jgi:DNA modification methylase
MLTQRVIHGDCNAVLQTLPSESIDFVLTDPRLPSSAHMPNFIEF